MFEQNVTLSPGTGTFSQHTLEILIMLLGAFLLGLWLGWALWAKYKQQIDKLSLENQSLNVTAETLRSELISFKTRLTSAETENNSLSSQSLSLSRDNADLQARIAALETSLAATMATNRTLDTELGLTYSPDTPISDDIPLEIIHNAIEQQAEPLEEPNIVLAENSPAPFVIEPIAIQETTPEKKKNTAAKKADTEKTSSKSLVVDSAPDDLTVVEGIGPKIQMLLNQYSIYTYRQLAETDVERLKEILSTAGPQLAMHDPGTWPSQANLAANDQWDTLKSVQGFLKGGKKPT